MRVNPVHLDYQPAGSLKPGDTFVTAANAADVVLLVTTMYEDNRRVCVDLESGSRYFFAPGEKVILHPGSFTPDPR